VDLALNSLADDKLQATVRCLAPHGHLLEIGKYDILKNTPLGMRPLHANISFQGIDLDSLFKGVMQDQARAARRRPRHQGKTWLACTPSKEPWLSLSSASNLSILAPHGPARGAARPVRGPEPGVDVRPAPCAPRLRGLW